MDRDAGGHLDGMPDMVNQCRWSCISKKKRCEQRRNQKPTPLGPSRAAATVAQPVRGVQSSFPPH
jgi:hypothetical protein